MNVKKMPTASFSAANRAVSAAGVGLSALLLAFPVQAATAGGASAPPPVPEFSWGGYIQAIVIMALMLVALWVVVWLLRRSGRFAGMPRGTLPKGSLYVEGQLNLAPRKGVVVVRFLNKRLVLGVTEQQISLLTELDLHDDQPTFTECLEQADTKESA